MERKKDLRLLTTFKCTNCEDGPCFVCTPRVRNYDDDFYPYDTDQVMPYYCPVNGPECEPKYKPLIPTPERMCYPEHWIHEQLFDFVQEHYDELPQFVRDAAYGELIAPDRADYLKPVDYLRLMSDAQYHHYEKDEAFKAVNKATKMQLVNELIPVAFSAGVIYAAIRYHGKSEYDELDNQPE